MGRGAAAQRELLEAVFSSLRPPDPSGSLFGTLPSACDTTRAEQLRTQERPRARQRVDEPKVLDIVSLLSTPDYADCIAQHLARPHIVVLARICRQLRAAVRDSVALSFVGLFRTPYGRDHGTQLFPHQRRSLAHMLAAESPPDWKFGELRGGILADDPGLGKTVTALGLIVATAGAMPAQPTEFFGSTSEGWAELRSNVQARRQLLPMVNALQAEITAVLPSEEHHRAHLDKLVPIFAFTLVESLADHPRGCNAYLTLEEFVRDTERIAEEAAATAHTKMGLSRTAVRPRLLEPVRLGINRMRSALDKRQRSWHASAVGRRAVFERSLLPVGATLVVVPAALLEHWFEQILRHIDLRAISFLDEAEQDLEGRQGRLPQWMTGPFAGSGHLPHHEVDVATEGASTAPGAVWIDGLGDMATIGQAFRLPNFDRGNLGIDAFGISNYPIVLTTFERCIREAERSGYRNSCAGGSPGSPGSSRGAPMATSPLMRVRWLRLIVDEGHELGGHETVRARSAAHEFIANLPAERRWVMSGTPVAGARNMDVLSVDEALWQLRRLLAFLRAPHYGVDGDTTSSEREAVERAILGLGTSVHSRPGQTSSDFFPTSVAAYRWLRDVVRPMLATKPAGAAVLGRVLRPIMVRHTKADLKLPPPVYLSDWNGVLPKSIGEAEVSFTARVCAGAAAHVAEVMAEARREWRRLALAHRGPRPRAAVFSEYLNDLEQVTSSLESTLGPEAVAQHWGAYQSTELSRFRTQHCAYRACPRCGMHNDLGGIRANDICERRLIEVALEPHQSGGTSATATAATPGVTFVPGLSITGASIEEDDDFIQPLHNNSGCDCCKTRPGCDRRAWPVEPERVWVQDPSVPGGWRPWAIGDFSYFNNFGQVPTHRRRVWIDADSKAVPDSTLPAPVWPSGTPPLGGPNGRMLPGRLRGWARCGTYVKKMIRPTAFKEYGGLPPVWMQHNVPMGDAAQLRNAPWQKKVQDCYILMLDEHGAHGLDLYFVTHLFIVNPIKDPGLYRQVVARAHRMGASASVKVQTMVLWND